MGKPIVGKRKRGHVSRREKAKLPQLVEQPKRTLLIRSSRTGLYGQQLLRDVKKLQGGERGLLFSRKNEDVRPFENETSIEFFCNKNECGLFTLASHSKKRPNNVVFGRVFDNQLLDMVEVGVDSYESIDDIMKRGSHTTTKALGGQTAVIFQGEGWDSTEALKTLRSLFLDMFKQEPHAEVDMSAIDHLCVCTAIADEKVYVRNYVVAFKAKEGTKKESKVGVVNFEGAKIPDIQLVDMGPNIDLSLRRNKLPSPELMKMSLKQAKLATEAKKRKNVTHDDFQGKVGRIHMKKQDMANLVTRSRFSKVLKRGKAKAGEKASPPGTK